MVQGMDVGGCRNILNVVLERSIEFDHGNEDSVTAQSLDELKGFLSPFFLMSPRDGLMQEFRY